MPHENWPFSALSDPYRLAGVTISVRTMQLWRSLDYPGVSACEIDLDIHVSLLLLTG
jgi:hypothetical protein